ncbi:MAG: serine/threonine-protein kinase [Pseudomonadota bacterium]
MLEAGRQLGAYRVEELVGHGGMAEVYRVRHEVLGRTCALKVLRLASPTMRTRLLAEGRAQARLRHPNVVSVVDILEVDGAPALVLDFIEGPTLGAWLSEHRPDRATALEVFLGILAGVQEAHAQGFVHRDLKPANILLERHGARLCPKVTDFGIAKVLRDDMGTLAHRGYRTLDLQPEYASCRGFRQAPAAPPPRAGPLEELRTG